MSVNQMTDEQISLILMGLRSIYVHESEQARAKLIKKCEDALAARGLALAE